MTWESLRRRRSLQRRCCTLDSPASGRRPWRRRLRRGGRERVEKRASGRSKTRREDRQRLRVSLRDRRSAAGNGGPDLLLAACCHWSRQRRRSCPGGDAQQPPRAGGCASILLACSPPRPLTVSSPPPVALSRPGHPASDSLRWHILHGRVELCRKHHSTRRTVSLIAFSPTTHVVTDARGQADSSRFS